MPIDMICLHLSCITMVRAAGAYGKCCSPARKNTSLQLRAVTAPTVREWRALKAFRLIFIDWRWKSNYCHRRRKTKCLTKMANNFDSQQEKTTYLTKIEGKGIQRPNTRCIKWHVRLCLRVIVGRSLHALSCSRHILRLMSIVIELFYLFRFRMSTAISICRLHLPAFAIRIRSRGSCEKMLPDANACSTMNEAEART